MAGNRVFVIGVGMTKFEKPGRRRNDDGSVWDYPDMAREAGTAALSDAGVDYTDIEQAYVGYVFGESTAGQRAAYELGLTGIPIVNVNNNCSTGSTALFMAAQVIRGGLADCTLALGFEKMQPGSLGATFDDRENPLAQHMTALGKIADFAMPPAPWMFGVAGREHMQQHGSTPEHFAKIGVKNHRHSVNNPYSQFQDDGRSGIGAALINTVINDARTSGSSAVTLTTFIDVPWNGPYYRRLGFEYLPTVRETPGLRAIRAAEADHGLDRWPRACMRLELD